MRVRCATSSLALVVAAAALPAQATVPGWTYAINVTFDSGTGVANRGSMAMRYQSTAKALRMEIVQVAGTVNRATQGVNIEGMYTLMNDADSTLATVLPAQHAATIMQNPMYMFTDSEKPSVDANTTTKSFEDLGAGEKILGHATHRYRTTTTGTVTYKTAGGICTRSADGEAELWVAPDVDVVPAMQSMVAHYGLAIPDSVTTQRSKSLPVKGVPLRTKMRTTSVTPTGESRVIETTMEYVELSNAPLDASLFVIPSDYHIMDMRKQMAGIVARVLDSTKAAGAGGRAAGCP